MKKQKQKKQYQRPALQRFGNIEQLTLSATQYSQESSDTQTAQRGIKTQ